MDGEGQGGVLRAVMFTDLVGSTALRAELGDADADDLRRRHDELLRRAVTTHRGTVVKGVGDGVLAAFPNVADAVAAAVAMQQIVVRLGHRVGIDLSMRVGVSLGDVRFEDGDCHGMAVVEAARLCQASSGGQVLCSDLVERLVRGDHEFAPVGDLELKGIPGTVATFELRWPSSGPGSVPLPAPLAGTHRFPFVGRAAQREQLMAAFDTAASGRRRTVFVSGEPGVGKTRLITQVASELHADGALVLAGRCDEDVGVAYQPFVEGLAHFVEHRRRDQLVVELGRFGGDLTRLLPELPSRVDGLPPPLHSDEQRERQRLFDAVVAWLASASADRPLLLVLDDLHWAGEPTLQMLRHVLRSSADMAVLVVGVYRDTDLDRTHPLADLLADVRRDTDVIRIALAGLTIGEVARFLRTAAGHEPEGPGPDLAEALHTETEGNPFFLEEVVVYLAETGMLHRDDSGRWTTTVDSIGDLGIPEGIREVVGRRLSRLSDDTNDVLRMAAVLGPEFDIPVLAAMRDGGPSDAALEEAHMAGLLTVTDETTPTYAFTHALVRHTLLDELSPVRRQHYHLLAADALQASHARPGTVVAHLRRAGAAADPGRVVEMALAAADQARHQHAWEEATAHWQAALELLDVRADRNARTARLLEQLGDAMYYTQSDWERGIEQLERAKALYDELGDHQSAAKTRSKLARNLSNPYLWHRDVPRARANLDEALERLTSQEDTLALGYTYVTLANVEWLAGRHHDGEQAARRALQVGQRLELESVQAAAKMFLAGHQIELGAITTGLANLRDAYDQAVRLGHASIASLGATFAVSIVSLPDPTDAERWVDQELDSGRHDRAPGLRLSLVQTRYWALLLQGRAGEVRQSAQDSPIGFLEPLLLAHDGHLDSALELNQEMREQHRRDGAGLNERTAGLWIGDFHRTLGHAEEAVAAYEPVAAGSIGDGSVLNQIHACARLPAPLIELGRHDEARHHAAQARQLLQATERHRALHAVVALAEATTAPPGTDPDRLFTTAIETFTDLRLPWQQATALEQWAHRSGQPHHLDAAADIYTRIGAGTYWTQRTRRLRTVITGTARTT